MITPAIPRRPARLPVDPTTSTANEVDFSDEGIIEQNTDIDYFSFTVDGLGGVLNLDVNPFTNGPNLDILAKILDSSGNVLYTSNPVDDLPAGSNSLITDANGDWLDGGWLDSTGNPVLDPSTGKPVTELFLQTGTYFLSVEGTGKPADISNPMMPDWGYSNYGSLGAYTITGSLLKNLVVGVDFDASGQPSPTNWNQYTGSANASDTLTGLVSEAGLSVPYELTISTTGSSLNTVASANAINSADLPAHAVPLDDLGGAITAQEGETLTFTWSNLDPWTYHDIYVFGHADFAAHNVVTITGGDLDGEAQTKMFTQVVMPDDLQVNDVDPSNNDLSTFAYAAFSDGFGQITITVTTEPGFEAGIAGLAIVSERPIGTVENGTISGQKWNDEGVLPDNSVRATGLSNRANPGSQALSSISTKTTTDSSIPSLRRLCPTRRSRRLRPISHRRYRITRRKRVN